ncbi:MAG TPA: nucleoside hydrolase [Roseiflexaceae bacterium]|nr:nucleoside hydrolase [Roseiflexaceae bacterium]HMP39928.1 nucleoside hydrolase [Roseiflexaceae bacterium]
MNIIFDTDIGTDVDDCLALAFVLGSPEFNLLGVTCVYGDVLLRARMVRKLLQLRGRSDIPVYAGTSRTLLGLRSIYWEGHEGEGLLTEEDAELAPETEHAVDYLIRTVMERPGEIHLLAIGPLTNVALALVREPRLASALAGITIMGGVARGIERLDLPVVEHNIICDPEAAQIVLGSGAPITLVPLDVTTCVSIRTADAARIRAGGTAYHAAVAEQVERYPRFARQGSTFLHDPLAAAIMLRPELVTFQSLHVDVETSGRLTTGATIMRAPSEKHPATARVALGVDIAAAEAFVIERAAAT